MVDPEAASAEGEAADDGVEAGRVVYEGGEVHSGEGNVGVG